MSEEIITIINIVYYNILVNNYYTFSILTASFILFIINIKFGFMCKFRNKLLFNSNMRFAIYFSALAIAVFILKSTFDELSAFLYPLCLFTIFFLLFHIIYSIIYLKFKINSKDLLSWAELNNHYLEYDPDSERPTISEVNGYLQKAEISLKYAESMVGLSDAYLPYDINCCFQQAFLTNISLSNLAIDSLDLVSWVKLGDDYFHHGAHNGLMFTQYASTNLPIRLPGSSIDLGGVPSFSELSNAYLLHGAYHGNITAPEVRSSTNHSDIGDLVSILGLSDIYLQHGLYNNIALFYKIMNYTLRIKIVPSGIMSWAGLGDNYLLDGLYNDLFFYINKNAI
jgi:hypothetical protein